MIQLTREILTVLDQNGRVSNFDIKRIRTKRNKQSRDSIVMDVRQNKLHENDSVLIVEGDYKGKKGVVKRLWRNQVFVKCPSVNEHGGLVVVRNRQVEVDGESKEKRQMDSRESIETQNFRPGRMDYASTKQGSKDKKEQLNDGKQIIVTQGRYKGLRGYILDSNGK